MATELTLIEADEIPEVVDLVATRDQPFKIADEENLETLDGTYDRYYANGFWVRSVFAILTA
jgi:hypothetical protein